MLILLIWRVIRRNNRRGRENKLLKDSLDDINRTVARDLAESTRQLEAGKRELVKNNLRLAQLESVMAELQKTLNSTTMKWNEKQSALKSLLAEIGISKNLWESFDSSFNSLHPDFYAKLAARYPTITIGEARMCAYIALGLGNKEIALMTNRSVRTVEAVKYNLAKKLQLEENETILSRLNAVLV